MKPSLKIYCFTILWLHASCSPLKDRPSTLDLVGGTKAKPNEFPSVIVWSAHQAHIANSYCTGTKVSPTKILTAAHCVLSQELTKAPYQGVWREDAKIGVHKKIDFSPERSLTKSTLPLSLTIKAVLLPPQVTSCLNTNDKNLKCRGRVPIPDVAILEIIPDEIFTALPSTPVNYKKINEGDQIIVMGFGSTGDRSTAQPYLKYHYSSVAKHADLAEALVGTEADRDGMPTNDQFFGSLGRQLGENYANLGSGDSGGPVLQESRQGLSIVGINSDGFCKMKDPAQYADCQSATNSFFFRVNKNSSHGVGEWLAKELE